MLNWGRFSNDSGICLQLLDDCVYDFLLGESVKAKIGRNESGLDDK